MNIFWKKMICLGLVFSSGLLIAADEEQQEQTQRMRRQRGNRQGGFGENRGGWGGNRQGGFRQGGFGGMMLNRISKEAEIEAKYKEEYAAIAKQMIDAEKKLAELAKKANVELPSETNMVLRQLKMKYPAEFDAIRKKMQSRETMFEGMNDLQKLAEKENLKLPFGGMRGPRPGGSEADRPQPPKMRSNPQAELRKVKKEFPEEWSEIQKLQKEGKREEAQAKLRELLRQVNDKAGKKEK